MKKLNFQLTTYHKILAVLLAVLLICFTSSVVVISSKKFATTPVFDYTIVLDAGHGGIDGGVSGAGSGVKESDLNLIYTFLLAEKLNSAGFNVVFTRADKGGLYGLATSGFKKRDMNKRREIISNSKANLVISIHMNKFSSKSRYGAQVFFLKPNTESMTLANNIQKALNVATNNKFSALKGDYFILKCCEAPSVIVECGFLSNPTEEMLLQQKDYQDKIVTSIFNGIMLYLYGNK